MNRQSATPVQVSSLPQRQALLFSLALLLTLIAGQLYSSWEAARSADQLAAQVAQVQALRSVAPLPARILQATSVTAPAVVGAAVPRDRWVF
ncbi:hypothetical protein EXN22_01990 [Pseudomonas tructae]|uniref:Uncharacterized protein n=1 Tax=Pseudomonas tructae TaxID=2518644 RepID=A0A411MCI3_9PSED|nr:hypothetical protein [Pseudomonas tructae]QBF24515.1 hypothetical protein EXN22_01990 [Pseudomonas tructae]